MEEIKTVQDYTAYMQAHPELTVCPIRRTLDVMGGKWKIFIVLQLFGAEQLRFGELARGVEGEADLSLVTCDLNTMLSNCLRELEKDGIILRRQFNEVPPHVEYSLTEKGRTLSSVLLALVNWGLAHPD